MTIFVHQDQLYGDKWHSRYAQVLSERYGVDTRVVDFLSVPLADIAPEVSRNDGLIGRWGHLKPDIEGFGRIYDRAATLFGGRIFPAPHTYLYYDNKFRQASFFLNRGYPTPATAVVESVVELEAFLAREALSLPVVVKDARGAQSSGVRLLLDVSQASFPCVAQRYCPGNTCDYRVVVIGHRVMGFMRRNRKNDFRASGSKDVVHLKELDPGLVSLAHRISMDNSFDSMAYDFVKLGSEWVVLEMSYTYPHWSLRDCEFFYDTRTGEQVSKIGVYPEDFIAEDFMARYYPHLD